MAQPGTMPNRMASLNQHLICANAITGSSTMGNGRLIRSMAAVSQLLKTRAFAPLLVILVLMTSVGAVLAAGAVWSRPDESTHPALTLPPLKQVQATGQIKEFELDVGRTGWELAPGKTVDAYAYNGQVPGPELRVTEGDTVRVTVKNALQEPTTVHWHGVEVPVGMDGVLGLSQAPIQPGDTFTYEFVAIPAGTRWYHAHANELAQQGGGLVGALIIEPRDPQPQSARPDREFTLVSGEWVTSSTTAPTGPMLMPTPGSAGGMDSMMGQGAGPMAQGVGRLNYDTFTLNGKTYSAAPPLMVRQGERVRLRLINANATDTQIFALPGHRLSVTHTDGNVLQQPVQVEAVPLGVGERADVEFVADNPGRWQLEAFMPALSSQGEVVPLSDIVYEGHEADAAQDFAPDAQVRIASYANFGGPPHPDPPDRVYELTLSGGVMMGMGSPTNWTINGKNYPNTDPLEVHLGQRVRLKLLNMSMEDHPMHLHGHTFQVVAANGRAIDGPLKDTLTVRHMEQYEIEFVADNPGDWLFHCHNLVHMGGGLMTEIHYR